MTQVQIPDHNDVLLALERWGAARDWVGPDPYEGLNSPLGRITVGRRPRQAVIQASKRLPIPPPWPLRAKPRANAKALGLVLSGYCTPRFASADRQRRSLKSRIERLGIELSGGTIAWGYPFDAQTRHLFYSSGTPNAIATCFVDEALLDLHTATGDGEAAELALRSRTFLLSLLARDPSGNAYFSYVDGGSELVHNANVMVAGMLARMHALEPDVVAAEAALEAVRTAEVLQPATGIWPYGERDDLGWADNFHHAYILDGLLATDAILGAGGDALERGISAWREHFFGPNDEARFYPDTDYPIEAHSYASAIDCLCGVAARRKDRESLEFAGRLAQAAIRDLWLPDDGRFAFRRTARGLNKREFVRWTNAPMFRALARLGSAQAGQPADVVATASRATTS
jgi:polysaccharide biosynthesis protein VpsJ